MRFASEPLGRNKKSRRYGADGLSPKRWGLFVCYFFGPFLWALVKANIDVALRIITGRVKPGIVKVPVIASGGAGRLEYFYDVLTEGKADAVLAASVFHYGTFTVRQVKEYLKSRGVEVRF